MDVRRQRRVGSVGETTTDHVSLDESSEHALILTTLAVFLNVD